MQPERSAAHTERPRARERAIRTLQAAIIDTNNRPAKDPMVGIVRVTLPILEAEALLAVAQEGC